MRKNVGYDMHNIGLNIRAVRARAGLTQEEFCEIIDMSVNHLSAVERGLEGISVPTLIEICNKLNVSADFILFGGNNIDRLALIEKIQILPKDKADYIETGVDLLLETSVLTNADTKSEE